jgi:hypothetical protein
VGRAMGQAQAGKKKTSYINHENTFSGPFEPMLSSAIIGSDVRVFLFEKK